jgi:hypothetical protein
MGLVEDELQIDTKAIGQLEAHRSFAKRWWDNPGYWYRRQERWRRVGVSGSVWVSLCVFGRAERPVDGMVRCGKCACENIGCVVLVGRSYSVFGLVSELA